MDVTIPAGFDFTDPDLFSKRLPHDEWRKLRQTEPIHRVDKRAGSDGFDDDHYWLVTKHADVKEISRLTGEVFSAGENTMIPRFAEGTDRSIIEAQRSMRRMPSQCSTSGMSCWKRASWTPATHSVRSK